MATHVGTLPIMGMTIPCANLEGGVRVLSQRGFYGAMGLARPKGRGQEDRGDEVPGFLAAKNLEPFISNALRAATSNPILYRFENIGDDGRRTVHAAHGIDGTLIPEICDVFLKARDAEALHHTQTALAKTAEIIMRALARTGIIALIDEATGYQADRDKDELVRLVNAYVDEEFRKWTQRFPHEFFKQIHRIQGWPYVDGQTSHPAYVGKLINQYIYARLPEGVLDKLREVNPVQPHGRRSRTHHVHLTDDTGIPHLDKQLSAVTTLLAVSDDKMMFEELLHRRFPKRGDQGVLPGIVRTKPRGPDEDE
jgi:hypothetical protein